MLVCLAQWAWAESAAGAVGAGAASDYKTGVCEAILATSGEYNGTGVLQVAGQGKQTRTQTNQPVEMVQVKLVRILSNSEKSTHMAILGTISETPTYMALWVGQEQAEAIQKGLSGSSSGSGVKPPNPMTHDLMARIVGGLGGKVTKVEVSTLDGKTLHARLYLSSEGGLDVVIDARPDDSLALASGKECTIWVAARILQIAGFTMDDIQQEMEKRQGGEDGKSKGQGGRDQDGDGNRRSPVPGMDVIDGAPPSRTL